MVEAPPGALPVRHRRTRSQGAAHGSHGGNSSSGGRRHRRGGCPAARRARVGRHLDPGLEGRSDPGRRELRHRCVAVGHVVARGRPPTPRRRARPRVSPSPSPSPTASATPTPTARPTPTTKPTPSPTAKPRRPRPRRLGPQVLQLQRRLSELGYWLGEPTGRSGRSPSRRSRAPEVGRPAPRRCRRAADQRALEAGIRPG